MLTKEQGELDFNLPALHLERKVRAFYPWPSAYLRWNGEWLKIRKSAVTDVSELQPGERAVRNQTPLVGTSKGALLLLDVQPAGKNWMSGKDFLRGARNWAQA